MDIRTDQPTIQKFLDFVRTKEDFTANKVMFVNALNFVISKYDPDTAEKAITKGKIPGVNPQKKGTTSTTAKTTTNTISSTSGAAKPKVTVGGLAAKTAAATALATTTTSKSPPKLGRAGGL